MTPLGRANFTSALWTCSEQGRRVPLPPGQCFEVVLRGADSLSNILTQEQLLKVGPLKKIIIIIKTSPGRETVEQSGIPTSFHSLVNLTFTTKGLVSGRLGKVQLEASRCQQNQGDRRKLQIIWDKKKITKGSKGWQDGSEGKGVWCDNLSSVLRTHVAEETTNSCRLASDLYTYTVTHECSHTYTLLLKKNSEQNNTALRGYTSHWSPRMLLKQMQVKPVLPSTKF